MKPKNILIFFLIFISFLAAWANYRFLDIAFLPFRSIDEYAFHGSLLNMYEGLVNFNLQKLFSFKFYSYGFVFFLINLIAGLPGLMIDNAELSIFIPRMVSAFFAIISLWYIYKISIQFIDEYSALLILVFIVAIPAFFWNAAWFHPDWMMTCFLIVSIYYFNEDNRRFSKKYWKAIILFGIAIGVKVQAIVFLPFLLSYIFFMEAGSFDFSLFKKHWWIAFKSLGILILVFVLCNPYLLHPKGFVAFKTFFLENLESNSTNHGTFVELSYLAKLNNVIDSYYLNHLFFLLLAVSLVYFAVQFFRDKKYTIYYSVAWFGLINVIYLLWMVNKDWQHYYLPVIIISLLIFIPLFNKIAIVRRRFLIAALCVIQVLYYLNDYPNILHNSYKDGKPIELEKEKLVCEYISSIIKSDVNSQTNVLISPYIGFDFKSLGMNYNSVHIIWGELSGDMIFEEEFVEKSFVKDPSKFKVKDYIILRKDKLTKSTKGHSKEQAFKKHAAQSLIDALYNGTIGYTFLSETRDIVIFKKVNG